MSDPVDLEAYREAQEPHFVLLVMCRACMHAWTGVVHHECNQFAIQCPACGAQKSFVTTPPELVARVEP